VGASSADGRLDGERMTADPDDGDADHASETHLCPIARRGLPVLRRGLDVTIRALWFSSPFVRGIL
jgi:hypothetical protein